ncbi:MULTISPECIES: hypothetical protein [Porphyromonadaceae]|uniref:Uncharacterized protein n=1 Tax=Sanguibacteroides justesenii TaxID=1547597 RepID=A0A0C3NKA8_9PORP|nr:MULTISPECIES: hypothetical protein [Porphyromonadaceae]KIO46657.1 hypothetical protein BA92_01975 [Sanguibacteroides justesenii]
MGKDKIYFKAILLLSTIIMTSFMFIPEEKKDKEKKGNGGQIRDTIILFEQNILHFNVSDSAGNALKDIIFEYNKEKSPLSKSNSFQICVSQNDSIIEIHKENFKTFRLKLIVQKKKKEALSTAIFLTIHLTEKEKSGKSCIARKKIVQINPQNVTTIKPESKN